MEPGSASRPPRPPQVYAPTPSRIGAVGVGLFALWWAGDLAASGEAERLVGVLPWLLLACLVAYAVFWRPAVRVDDGGVTLRNIVRDVRVPWPALTGLETRYALTLVTEQGRYQSWAAAAPGRPNLLQRGLFDRRLRAAQESPQAGRSDAADPRWIGEGARTDRSSSALTADSGAAAFLVETAWARWRDANPPGADGMPAVEGKPAGDAAVRLTWSLPVLVGTAVLLAAGLLTLLL